MKQAILSAVLLGALPHLAAAQPKAPDQAGADDLAKAADAAADLANVPPPDAAKGADASAAGAPASSGAAKAADDVDLAALGLDPASAAYAFDDKLNIYGFADLTWQNAHWTKTTPFVRDATTFYFGSLNVYLARNFSPAWRSLVEVRFMYAPNGTANRDGTTNVTTSQDVANQSRPIEWGSISIERAYIEYDLHPRLTVRAGHWLTPYGIWNTDHGSPTILTAFRPYVIGDALFPEHQTGLSLFGRAPVGDYQLGYEATLSNGRSETEIIRDTDREPAIGGRMYLEGSTFKLGVSGYAGRATGATTSTTVPPAISDERAFAADAQLDLGALHLQGEFIARNRKFLDGNRPLTITGMPQGDGTDTGWYLVASYRFKQLWNATPFVTYEEYRPRTGSPGAASVLGDIVVVYAGLNFRPLPNVVLKLAEGYAWSGPTALAKTDIYVTFAQVAWAF